MLCKYCGCKFIAFHKGIFCSKRCKMYYERKEAKGRDENNIH